MDFLDQASHEPHLGGKHYVSITLNNGEVVHARDGVHRLREMLIKKAVELGRFPSREELASDPEMPHPDHYEFCWGSYAKAVLACYWEWKLRTGDSKADFGLSEEGIKKAEDYLRRQKELTTMKGSDDEMAKHYSNEELLDLLRVKKGQLGGKNPTMEQLKDDPKMPNVNTYIRRFGSWSKALALIAGSWIVPEEEAKKLEEQADAKKAKKLELSEPEVEAPLIVTEADAYHAASPEDREKNWPEAEVKTVSVEVKKLAEPVEMPPEMEVEPAEPAETPPVIPEEIKIKPDGQGKVEIQIEVGSIKLSITVSQ